MIVQLMGYKLCISKQNEFIMLGTIRQAYCEYIPELCKPDVCCTFSWSRNVID